MMYQVLPADESVSQGDIIEGCPLIIMDRREGPVDPDADPAKFRARVVVLPQAFDLAQGKNRNAVTWVHEATSLIAKGILKAQTVRDQVRCGPAWGWYVLPSSREAPAFPDSIVDLRDLHTVSRRALEQLINDGRRIGRIVTPFREHLGQHFGVTYM